MSLSEDLGDQRESMRLFTQLGQDGRRYVFALPVYNHFQEDVTFATGGGLYGGGGIVPDIFVPLEVKKGEEGLAYLLNSGVVGHFVFEQIDKDRNYFKKLSYATFLTDFEKDESYISKFENYLKNAGLDIKLSNNKQIVKTHLTAEFARQLFGETQYYQILLKNDLMIKEVLE